MDRQDIAIYGPFVVAVVAGMAVLARSFPRARLPAVLAALGLAGLVARTAFARFGFLPAYLWLGPAIGDNKAAKAALQAGDQLQITVSAMLLVAGVVTGRGRPTRGA